MNARTEERRETNEAATLRVLGPVESTLPVTVAGRSGQGMRVSLDRPLPSGTLVRIDLANSLLLGEVCYCRREGDRWAAGLKLEHSLTHTGELAQLAQELLEQMPEAVSDLAWSRAAVKVTSRGR